MRSRLVLHAVDSHTEGMPTRVITGGIGTIPGAILGAVVMQSLRSGMSLLNVDSPMQDVIVGVVLVTAVGLDTLLRRKAG